MSTDISSPSQLEPTPPEVKRYQRQKITLIFINTLLTLAVMAALAFLVGPEVGRQTTGWTDWVRLLASAALLGSTLEWVRLPLSYYSGFVLEHRFQLSNQTRAGWLRKRVKG